MTAGDETLGGPVVVVTRDEGPDGPLTRALEASGARVVPVRAIAYEPALDEAQLDRALSSPEGYDWIVFTSPRAVDAVCSRPAWAAIQAASGKAAGAGRPASRLAAAGRSTAERLASYGSTAEIVAEPAGASALAAALRGDLLDGVALRGAFLDGAAPRGAATDLFTGQSPEAPPGRPRVLWPRSEIAELDLADALRAAGAEVTAPIAYRTVAASPDTSELVRLLHGGGLAAVTFLSPSSAEGLAHALGAPDLSVLAGRTLVASIGPTTSAALASLGAPADVESKERTAIDLAAAVMSALAARKTDPGSLRKERPR